MTFPANVRIIDLTPGTTPTGSEPIETVQNNASVFLTQAQIAGNPPANSITNAMLAQAAALTVKGNPTNALANVQDVAGTADQVLRVNSAGTSWSWGAINLASTSAVSGVLPVPNGGIGVGTLTAHGVVLGNGTSPLVATAVMSNGQLLVGQSGADPLPKTVSGDATLAASGALTISNLAVTTAKIADNAVDNTKIADMAQDTLKGRADAAGTGDPTDLTKAQVDDILRPFLSRAVSLVSTPVTLTAADSGKLFNSFNANRTVNLPAVAAGLSFAFYTLDGGSGGTLTVTPTGGANLIFADGSTASAVAMPTNTRMVIASEGSNWIVYAADFRTDITTTRIVNNAVDNTKIADMAQATIKGRAFGAGTGDPQDLTPQQAMDVLQTADALFNTLRYNKASQTIGGDLNTLAISGFFDGSSLSNAPGGSADWFYIISLCHSNNPADWRMQIAIQFPTDSTVRGMWFRTRVNTVWGPWKSINAGMQTLTDGATINWDFAVSRSAKVTLGGNRTVAAPTNFFDGEYYALHVIQDGVGSRTLTWNGVFKFPGGVAPVLTTTAGARDVFTFTAENGNLYGTWMNDVK